MRKKIKSLNDLGLLKSNLRISDATIRPSQNIKKIVKNNTPTLGERWAKYITNKVLLTTSERNELKEKIKILVELTEQQFEVFNHELIRRSGIKQNQRELKSGSIYDLNDSQRRYLKNLVDYISPNSDLGESPLNHQFEHPSTYTYNVKLALEGINDKCPKCHSRNGQSKTIFQSKILAESFSQNVINKFKTFQEPYRCDYGYGWHLRTQFRKF